jgi:tetratricopeptide (TPR) repeat protein
MVKLAFILFVAIIFGGCSKVVSIHSYKPATVYKEGVTHNCAVVGFGYDDVGLSDMIEAKMSKVIIDGNKYFTLANRSDIKKILREQNFQHSGVVNNKDIVKLSQIIGAKSIITGKIVDISTDYSYYKSKRTKCEKDKCHEYYVRCKETTYTLSANIKMIDAQNSDVLYADSITTQHTNDSCYSNNPAKAYVLNSLANEIGNIFVSKISPQRVVSNVYLLEDADIEYSSEQEKLLEYSIEYIEKNRLQKAKELLNRLIDSTNKKSYVPIYNLGVIYESSGEYLKAYELYKRADFLTIEPIDEIDSAMVRIKRLINNRKVLDKQMKRGEVII